MSGLLTREQILAAADLQFEEVKVPEWGGKVRVRGMTGAERDTWEASLIDGRGDNKRDNRRLIRATLVSLTVVDETGQRLFTEDDVLKLGDKAARSLQRVYNVAQRLSRVSEADVEELAGN